MQRWVILVALLLAGCSESSAPPVRLPVSQPAPAAQTVDDLVDAGARSAPVTVVGVAEQRAGGALLGAGRARDGKGAWPIWIDGAQLTANAGQLVVVTVSGTLVGPGAFGPDGRARYQIVRPKVVQLTPSETTIQQVSANQAFSGRLVRLSGTLLVGETEALLIDRVGSGGMPSGGSRQIKLELPRSVDVLPALAPSGSGAVRAGSVQIEGMVRDGAIVVFQIDTVR